MMALQMDPAPGLAAGKGTVEKVWDPKKKRCSSPMHDTEPGASSMHDDEPAGVIDDEVDESKFVTACGALSKQKGAFEIKHVPASFWKREAFSQLSSKGLAKVPPGEGWQIAHHSQTPRLSSGTRVARQGGTTHPRDVGFHSLRAESSMLSVAAVVGLVHSARPTGRCRGQFVYRPAGGIQQLTQVLTMNTFGELFR